MLVVFGVVVPGRGRTVAGNFRDCPPGRWLVYFTYLAPKTCGIREAHYSIDSEALDQVVPLPACDLSDPYGTILRGYDGYRKLAERPRAAKIQILYADGTKSEVVTIRP